MLGSAFVVSGIAFLIGVLSSEVLGPPYRGSFWLYVLAAAFAVSGALTWLLDGTLPIVTRRWPKASFVLGGVAVAGCVFASSRVGVPKALPGIALGWTLLFHIERGAALLGAMGLIALVLWRGANGEWPNAFGNLFQYAPKEAVSVTADALEKQDDRISIIERELGLSPPQRT